MKFNNYWGSVWMCDYGVVWLYFENSVYIDSMCDCLRLVVWINKMLKDDFIRKWFEEWNFIIVREIKWNLIWFRKGLIMIIYDLCVIFVLLLFEFCYVEK